MKSLFDGLKVFIFMTLLLGIIYPYSILYIVNMTMPRRSAGSLIYIDNQLRGSKLFAQKFNQNIYFWPRPSSVDYNTLPAGQASMLDAFDSCRKISRRLYILAWTSCENPEERSSKYQDN